MPDSTTAITIVIANCLNSSPVTPPMNATGTNTEQSTSTIATSALATCRIAWSAARRGGRSSRRHDALDVLDHDDRVVDDDADREHETEQRQHVDRHPEREQAEERADHAHRHGEHRDERRAPALEEQEHDERHERPSPRRSVITTSLIDALTNGVVSNGIA